MCFEVRSKGLRGSKFPGEECEGIGVNLLRHIVYSLTRELECVALGGILFVSFGMTHLGGVKVNSTHAVGKVFSLMTRKHGLVILKKQSTSSFHANNVTQSWHPAKVFYE